MMASTHVVIGAVTFASLSALTGTPEALPLNGATLGAAALGALLPDVDTPSSRAGWCLYPLARWLERRFGHRTLTHSMVGTLLFALLCAPLCYWPFLRPLWPALVVGYLSHLFADAATKSGVPLAWPARDRYVFPGQERNRLKTGSLAEIGVLLVFLLVGALLVPVARFGPRRLLHVATASLPGAVRDAEDWGDDYRLEAHVSGYDVLHQKLVEGVYPVVGRREDGSLVIERSGDGASGYWLLKENGSELHRIAPRHVRLERAGLRTDQTVQIRVSNLTLAALSRALTKALPTDLPPEDLSGLEGLSDPQPAWGSRAGLKGSRFLHEILVSGAGECYPLPQEPEFAPLDVPQFGLKAVTFSGSKIAFDFAQPRHIGNAGSRVALQSAVLSVRLPRAAKVPNLQFPTQRREMLVASIRRQADLLVREGDLVRAGDALNRPFAQKLDHPLTPDEQMREAEAKQARRALVALEIEEKALKQRAPATWATLHESYRARRANLEKAAQWSPPAAPNAIAPPAARAPFDAVVEHIAWEPPTLPTRPGERPEHAARVSLVKIER